ncbi:DUF6415 family natural product biosynthesis protein [Streptomyces sp. NBC_01306]|uniref:DUF6415 family natural product biosynthesis protein n=1 Tax=Streptomyces sp. NBC_01306 TaxID=2903819 RepID=UPI00224CE1DE|nr:DUF6415 family natural product biosynthesis protein [Streptomyces sp. NBC_01306]MCX4728398.1 DUF6415 family natural product biosynthesis protein [Streptomyces sp. NBC_01306]
MSELTVLPAAPGRDPRPLDFETMRAVADRLLAQGEVPQADGLLTEIMMLRGFLALLVPAVGELAVARPVDDVWRGAAQAGLGEARRRLSHTTGHTVPVLLAEEQRLSRSVLALCTHLENLESCDA